MSKPLEWNKEETHTPFKFIINTEMENRQLEIVGHNKNNKTGTQM